MRLQCEGIKSAIHFAKNAFKHLFIIPIKTTI